MTKEKNYEGANRQGASNGKQTCTVSKAGSLLLSWLLAEIKQTLVVGPYH